MKNLLTRLPQFLAITGQSGSGKDTAAGIILEWLGKNDISALAVGSGDLIREYVTIENSPDKEARSRNNRGERASPDLAADLITDWIDTHYEDYAHLILTGTPRYASHCSFLNDFFVKEKYFGSIQILEVTAPEEICTARLIARTKADHRSDLSIEGKPGEPDLAKIETKISWWKKDESAIRDEAKKLGIYQSIANDGDLIHLKNQLATLFA